jgi:hypothetical protein
MEFDVFLNKKQVNGKIDFLSTYLKFNYDEIAIKDWVVIDAGFETAIDMISTVAYGKPDYLDYLVKFNRLNNPLYIPTGTIILVPDLNSMLSNIEFVDLTSVNSSLTVNQLNSFNQVKLTSSSPGVKTIESSNYTRTSNGAYIF